MNITKKTIILSQMNGQEKASIKFDNTFGNTLFELKLPLRSFQNDNYILIKTNSQNLKQQIFQAQKRYELNCVLNLEDKISILIIGQTDGEKTPLFWGGTDYCEKPQVVEEENKTQAEYQSRSNSVKSERDFFEETQAKVEAEMEKMFETSDEELEKLIDEELAKDQEQTTSFCSSCKYKQEFYNEQCKVEAQEALKEIAQMQEQNQAINENNLEFYNLVKSQYEEMFSKYPAYDVLSNIIPNSKWVKIDIGEPYVLGLIYENDAPRFMCYGVFRQIKQEPPIELADCSQWLPLDVQNPNGEGLWLMYQSAETGETIKVEIV